MKRLKPIAAAVAIALPAPAVAAEDITVLSVLAPGSGGNYVTEGERPPGTDSQLKMYERLPDALGGLGRDGLETYFKPAALDIAPDDIGTVTRPGPGVRIVRDREHHVPHVYGETREDAMFGVGYVRAEDRLWQMESFRAVWRAESASLLGPGDDDANIRADARTIRLIDYSEAEYQAMFYRFKTNYGEWGKQAARDIEQYIAGINAYLAAIESDPALLPLEYRKRGLSPRPWKVTDAMAMAAYSHVSWGSSGPGEEANAQVLRQLQERFGDDALAIYDDLRNAPDGATQHSLPAVSESIGGVDPASIALLDEGSFVPIEPAASDMVRRRKVRSNALLVAAEHSATGRPIAVQGPQDGYGTPHLFDSEIAIFAPDFRARGVLELSGPYPYVAARGAGYAWSITILPPDQADTFAEVLCEPDGAEPSIASEHYLYKGECIALETRVDGKPLPDGGTYSLTSVRSLHGPVIGRATVDGAPVALAQARAMYLHEEMDYPAHAKLFSPSVIRSASDFIDAVAGTAYNIGWWYIDSRDIAGVDAGLVPVRRTGAATDLPVWGTGEWDWVGFDPDGYTFRSPLKSQYPQAINGPDGVIAGWNNPSAAGRSLKDEAWGYGSANRVQLLKEPTLAAVGKGRISIAELVKIHTRAAITDYHAERVYPEVRRFLGRVEDPSLENTLEDADAWARAGGLLRDMDGDGDLEHGSAIALLDAFWNRLVENAFMPLFGEEMLREAGTGNNLPPLRPVPGDANPWLVKVLAGIKAYTGKPQEAFSRNYCGETEEDCRRLLLDSLARAAEDTAAKYGSDPSSWVIPATCRDNCRQIEFTPTGDMPAVAPISWQNRPTYVQVTTGEPR